MVNKKPQKTLRSLVIRWSFNDHSRAVRGAFMPVPRSRNPDGSNLQKVLKNT